MTRALLAACIVSVAITSAGNAQSAGSSSGAGTRYTRSQLIQMEAAAHEPAQYSALASYFAQQQTDYLQQAAGEKKEWERRSQNIVGIAAKYPRPVDSARYLYEFYMYKAAEAGTLEGKYSKLAAPATR